MVYSQARLEHALRVFRNASSIIRARGLRAKNLRSQFHVGGKYKGLPGVHTAKDYRLWQPASAQDGDIDSDDEYHPDKSQKKKKRKFNGWEKKPKSMKRKSENHTDEGHEMKAKRRRMENREDSSEPQMCYTTLKISSERGKLFLQVLADITQRDEPPEEPSLFRLTGGSFDDAKPAPIPQWMQLERELAIEGLDWEEGTLRSGRKRDKSSIIKGKAVQELVDTTQPVSEGVASRIFRSPSPSSAAVHDDHNVVLGGDGKSSTADSNIIIIEDTEDEDNPADVRVSSHRASQHPIRHAPTRIDRRNIPHRPRPRPAEREIIVIDDSDEDGEDSVRKTHASQSSVRVWNIRGRNSSQNKPQTIQAKEVIVIEDSD